MLAAVRVSAPEPVCCKLPVPEMTPDKVIALLRLAVRMPLLAIGPVTEPATVPLPRVSVDPLAMLVVPVKVLSPVKVIVPVLVAVRLMPPVPLITPPYEPEDVVSVKVCVPSLTPPVFVRVLMLAPEEVALMSRVPLSSTLLEVAMLPLPDKARVPAEMVVAPV